MKQVLFICILISQLPAMAQVNLVPNPSFEEFNICPPYAELDTSESIFNGLKYWFSPKTNYMYRSADYYNACANGYTGVGAGWGVPVNRVGYQLARTGQGYVAIALQSPPSWTTLRVESGIACKFTSALVKDSIYKVSFFVSLGENIPLYDDDTTWSLWSTDRFGAYIGYTNNYGFNTTIVPQILNTRNRFLDDLQGWMEVSGLYKASGGESYITISNFRLNADSSNYKIVRQGSRNNKPGANFYYLDDISVVSVGFEAGNLITDTLICYGGSITGKMRPDFIRCIWHDGDTSAHRILNKAGKYWVTSFSGNISVTDTFLIHLAEPEASLTDTLTCKGTTTLLISENAQHYLWNTQETEQRINVNQAGLYWVERFVEGCIKIDSFNVKSFPLPVISSLKDTTVCFDDVSRILLDAGKFKSYLWKPTGETTRTIFSTRAQVYLLTVTDSNNCTTHKQVAVMETCPDYIFVPNAFTPNGDGINDLFLPQTRNLQFYQVNIVNRWGQIVFTSQDPLQGWDGKNASADVYVASFQYQVTGKEMQSISKNITLLR